MRTTAPKTTVMRADILRTAGTGSEDDPGSESDRLIIFHYVFENEILTAARQSAELLWSCSYAGVCEKLVLVSGDNSIEYNGDVLNRTRNRMVNLLQHVLQNETDVPGNGYLKRLLTGAR